MEKPIYDLTKLTCIDYPDNLACIIWLRGCPLRCSFCYNKALVEAKDGRYTWEDVQEFLRSRTAFLDGVVFSGGECTMNPLLPEYASFAKQLGYKVKVDTNGTNPDMVKNMVDKGLVDYIALDYKSPREKFTAITGASDVLFDRFEQTLKFLIGQQQGGIGFEARTTVHTDLLSEDDINAIVETLDSLGYKGKYYIQGYLEGRKIETIGNMKDPSRSFDKSLVHSTDNITIEYRNL